MNQDLRSFWKLTGKGKDTLHVLKAGRVRMVGHLGVCEKTEKMISTRRDVHDLVTTRRVILHIFFPDRNDVRPPFPLLLREFVNTTNGQVDFHLVQELRK